MPARNVFEEIAPFLEAQAKAESEGRDEFTCPLCGGKAYWGRAYNGHLHCGCTGCGIRIAE